MPDCNFNLGVTLGGTINVQLLPPLPAPSPSQAGAWFSLQFNPALQVKARAPMSYTLPTDMMVGVQVTYTDAKGNPATVDGDVVWTSSDDNIAGAEPDAEDSTKANIVPAAKIGNVQITATADADLGSGVSNIIAVMSLTVVAGEAVAATIAPTGDPVPIPSS